MRQNQRSHNYEGVIRPPKMGHYINYTKGFFDSLGSNFWSGVWSELSPFKLD